MLVSHILLALGITSTHAATGNYPLAVHNITRLPGYHFENLAVRANGQIITTTAGPEAYIYQVDPLGIVPTTRLFEIPIVNGSAAGIAEGETDIFYVVAGRYDLQNTTVTYPDTYQVIKINMRDVFVFPNGTLNKHPEIKRVANLTDAQLPNGATFARPTGSNNLLVADAFRGLIWNVDVHSGSVKVALNDTATKGEGSGPAFTGINGIKEFNGSLYWTSTGAQKLWKVAINKHGNVAAGVTPTLITSNLTCDDIVIDDTGILYVAGPQDVITKVTPNGQQTIITGTYHSLNSSVVGPSALRFGRGVSDRWSLYITTNGGLPAVLGGSVPTAAGISRIDLGY